MERFTATSYQSAMKLAKTKFKNGFEVINTREIDLSNSALSDETLVEITVSPMDKIPEVITVNDNSTKINNDIILLIKNELAPIRDFQMEFTLLRQEIDLLSRRVSKLILPDLNENERNIFDSLCEIGFDNPMVLKFTRELSGIGDNQLTIENISKSFNQIFSNFICKQN